MYFLPSCHLQAPKSSICTSKVLRCVKPQGLPLTLLPAVFVSPMLTSVLIDHVLIGTSNPSQKKMGRQVLKTRERGFGIQEKAEP
jgi:hypothetical protein